jgi:hypothetical protein
LCLFDTKLKAFAKHFFSARLIKIVTGQHNSHLLDSRKLIVSLHTHASNFFAVAKIFAFILMASILVESISAAPLVDDHTQATRKPRNPKNPNHRRKNLGGGGGVFKGINETSWQNPCNSIEWIPGLAVAQNFEESHSIVSQYRSRHLIPSD